MVSEDAGEYAMLFVSCENKKIIFNRLSDQVVRIKTNKNRNSIV